MEWLSALRGLISAKVMDAIHITANTRKTISTDSNKNNKTQQITYTNNGNGNVNVFSFPNIKDLSPESLKNLKDLIVPAFENGDVLLLQNDSQKVLSDYKVFEKRPDVKNLLDFFKDKLSSLDYRLLETGLYEAYLLEHDLPKAQQIKAGVVNRYGIRGKNIVNLASGGYFNSHIQPLYEALSVQKDFKLSDFNLEYEKIIMELPFAIFVHNGLSDEDILDELNEKAEKNIKYGVSEETIILNGFGKNADRIEKLIPELKNSYQRVAQKVDYLGALKTIQVSVFYKEAVKQK